MPTAIEDLQFLQKRFAGILELLPTLEGISSVENHLKELRAKRDWMVKEVEKEDSALNQAKTETLRVLETANAEASAVKADAKAVLDKAKAQADTIVAKATADAEGVAAKSKAEVEGFDILIKAKTEEYKLLSAEADRLVDKLSQLSAQLTALKARL